MPDYNLSGITTGGDDLIEIGFEVEGYEVENIRGGVTIVDGGGTVAGRRRRYYYCIPGWLYRRRCGQTASPKLDDLRLLCLDKQRR